MQEKKDLIVGLASILCLVSNNTWDVRKIQNTETILYNTTYYQYLDIDNLFSMYLCTYIKHLSMPSIAFWDV